MNAVGIPKVILSKGLREVIKKRKVVQQDIDLIVAIHYEKGPERSMWYYVRDRKYQVTVTRKRNDSRMMVLLTSELQAKDEVRKLRKQQQAIPSGPH